MNFASDYTSRVRFSYTDTNAASHKAIMRFGTIDDPAVLVSKYNAIAAAILPLLLNTGAITDVNYAVVGSSTFSPLSGATVGAGTNSAGFDAATMAAGYYVFFDMHSTTTINGGPFYLFNVEPFYNRTCSILYTLGPIGWANLRDVIIAQGVTAIDRNALSARAHVIVGINDEVQKKLRR